MKRSTAISLLLSLTAIYLTYQYYFPTKEEIDLAAIYRKEHPDVIPSHFEICRAAKKPHETSLRPPSINYRGQSLVSRSTDDSDLVICPGDTFGDLNGTYVTLQDCHLTMYHQGKLIWSSLRDERSERGELLCVLSLQKDGDLTIKKEGWKCFLSHSGLVLYDLWESETDFHPSQTELRVRDQQLQIVQTFQNKSQRLFYTGENTRWLREYLGAPRQIAEKFVIKNHSDLNDSIILRRNEYLGDLNGMHLILQTNCQLQLKDNNQAIWSFAAYLEHGENCTLEIQGNSIGMSEIQKNCYGCSGVEILPEHDFEVLQSSITFQENQLFITQTLNNGSEITFYSEPGQENGLKLKKEPRQIAKNKIIIFDDNDNDDCSDCTDNSDFDSDDSDYDDSLYIIERLDYIGDLDGLHLILRDNCVLTLANGQEELWKLTQHIEYSSKFQGTLEGPFMECSLKFYAGNIFFDRLTNREQYDAKKHGKVKVFQKLEDEEPTKFEFSLENNLMIMTLEYENKTSEIYHAGANTNGTWFRFVSESSIAVNANDTEDLFLPNMGYIGDIHGVFTILDRRGNWILFNKTQAIWESGTTQGFEFRSDLSLTRDGNAGIHLRRQRWTHLWSTKSETTSIFPQGELSRTELLVNNNGMWLIKTFTDGTVDKYKALEWTSHFILMPNEYELIST